MPPVLAVGRLIEVWAADGASWTSAWVRYSRARFAWEDENPAPRALCRAGGAPWSTTDREEAYVRDRLARHGVTVADLPRLRSEALAWAGGSS